MTNAEQMRALMKDALYDELLVKIEKLASAKKPKNFIEVDDLTEDLIKKFESEGFNVKKNITEVDDGLMFDDVITTYKISW